MEAGGHMSCKDFAKKFGNHLVLEYILQSDSIL